MAKLSAGNRTEIWRVEKEFEPKDSNTITYEKYQYALMSDGNVLKKHVVRFKKAPWESKAKDHDYGWKVFKKVKPTADPARLLANFQAEGWKIVGTPNLDAFGKSFVKAMAATETGRFLTEAQLTEAWNLYHLGRTALSGTRPTKSDLIRYAAREMHRKYPSISETAVYKDLDATRNPWDYGR